MPSTRADAARRRASAQPAEARVRDGKRGSSTRERLRSPRATASGSRSMRDQPPAAPSRVEDEPGVAAAAEGGVDVGAVGRPDQRIDRLGQQHADVLGRAGCGHGDPSEAEVFSDSGSGDCITAASWAACRSASHSSKWLPMPSSMTSRTKPAERAVRGRSAGATRRRARRPSRGRGRRASSRSVHRQRRDLVAEASHAGRGKISSDPSGCLVTVSWVTPIAASSSRWRAGIVSRPLPSSVNAAGPLEDACHKTPRKCTCRHCSPAAPGGQRTNETKFNGINDLAQDLIGLYSVSEMPCEIRTCGQK